MRLLRSHGEAPRHHHELAAGTHRLDALQAAILEVKLRHLADWNQRRREAAAGAARGPRRHRRDPPRPGRPPTATTSTTSSSSARAERDALRDHLDARGIASAIHYPTPVHLQPAYADLGLGRGALPVAERLAGENCSLPIFPAIEDWQIAETVAAVREL